MCNCVIRPNVNGQPGYQWNSEGSHIRPIAAPSLEEGDQLLYDGPGRCGHGTDCHCHHFRLVKRSGLHYLLVRNGSGDDRIMLGSTSAAINAMIAAGESDCFWMLHLLYSTHRKAASEAQDRECQRWLKAAAEKRIKTRKCSNRVKVWVEAAQ